MVINIIIVIRINVYKMLYKYILIYVIFTETQIINSTNNLS